MDREVGTAPLRALDHAEMAGPLVLEKGMNTAKFTGWAMLLAFGIGVVVGLGLPDMVTWLAS